MSTICVARIPERGAIETTKATNNSLTSNR